VMGLAMQCDRLWPLAAVALALLPWWFHRRSGRGTTGRCVVQILAVVLLIAALTQPYVRRGGGSGDEVAVFVDVSASQAGLPDRLDLSPPPGWRVRQAVFADGVARAAESPGDGATLITPVLSLLASRAHPPAAAVIVTDGRFTDVAPPDLLGRIAADGPELLLVPRAPDAVDARIADLAAAVDPDGRVRLTTTVVADGANQRELRVARSGADAPLIVKSLSLRPGEPVTLRATDVLGAGEVGLYRAELAGGDLLAANDRLVVPVRRAEPVLLWVGDSRAMDPIGPSGWSTRHVAPADMPARSDELLAYAAIAVVDAGGRALSTAQRRAVAEYVNLGGGLLLIGAGPYGSPDDVADPLNRVAPLVVSPHAQRALDVTILLDASASMAEPAAEDASQRKFDLVRQAVMTMARRQLAAGDHLRVITFTGMPTERFDQPVDRTSLDALSAILAKVRPVGGTRVVGALRLGWEARTDPRRDRLVVVLSDLETEAFDPTPWAQRFSTAGVSLAVVAVGAPDESAPLARLARLAGGRFELRGDLTGLADVFIRMLGQLRGDPLIRRDEPVKVRPPLFATGIDALRRIDAHLAATAHPDADVLVATTRDEPLLARRRSGGGRVVGVAAPLEAPHNTRWRADAAIGTLLCAAVDWVGAPSGDGRYSGDLARTDTGAELVITAADDRGPINHLDLQTRWSRRDGTMQTARLMQIGPGRYGAALPVPIADPVVPAVYRSDNGRIVWSEPFPGRYGREFARTGVDLDALTDLACRTGGGVLTAAELRRRLAELHIRRRVDLWPGLIVAALCAALVDWLFLRGR